MNLTVINNNNTTIQVAINQWESDRKTRYFIIPKGQSETWDRSDEKGYVMSVKIGESANETQYYVKTGNINYTTDGEFKFGDTTTLTKVQTLP